MATLVFQGDLVLYADGRRVTAIEAQTGRRLWDVPCRPGFKSPADIFVIQDAVWIGPDFAEARDLRTGKVKKQTAVLAALRTAGHHHRCYREKATERYILGGYRGIEMLDLVDQEHWRNNWVRGVCQYGVLPCNGLIYAPPHACGCFMEAKLRGFWALASKRSRTEGRGPRTGDRLERGSAYGEVVGLSCDPSSTDGPESHERRQTSRRAGSGQGLRSIRSQAEPRAGKVSFALNSQPSTFNPSADWPTYRHDPLRSGSTDCRLPARLSTAWQAKVGGRLSAPVIAGGILLVSSIDSHRVVALDAGTGQPRWTFVAGGRVDSPPTIWNGLALFGSADGYVYCLRLTDGELVWRFQAAPENRKAVACDQLESVWPLPGSVLVLDGQAYVAAGRSSYLDGGLWFYSLDPRSGRLLHQSRIRSKLPGFLPPPRQDSHAQQIVQNATDYKTFLAPDRSDAFSMGGALLDVLVSDGRSVYLRQLRFDRQCRLQPTGGRHLFSTSSLLDDAENHRSHWVIGTGDFSRIPVAYSWIANQFQGAYGSYLARPYGLMLAFDKRNVWGVRRVYRKNGYLLFHQDRQPFAAEEQSRRDFQPKTPDVKLPAWSWSTDLPIHPRAIVRAGDFIVLGGTPLPEQPLADLEELAACYAGRRGGRLHVASAENGRTVAQFALPAPPVWDGMAVADRRLFFAATDGVVRCLAAASDGKSDLSSKSDNE
ncbi:MAG: PQQ-binding-like beta-propeller repeat protein [Planctomycetes bacterium]|nr:PQQ-binding-like beta-propeller repeat protein [Planctomycetota bacterium]